MHRTRPRPGQAWSPRRYRPTSYTLRTGDQMPAGVTVRASQSLRSPRRRRAIGSRDRAGPSPTLTYSRGSAEPPTARARPIGSSPPRRRDQERRVRTRSGSRCARAPAGAVRDRGRTTSCDRGVNFTANPPPRPRALRPLGGVHERGPPYGERSGEPRKPVRPADIDLLSRRQSPERLWRRGLAYRPRRAGSALGRFIRVRVGVVVGVVVGAR